MSQFTQCTVLLLVVHSAIAATLNVVSIPGNEICSIQERKDAAIQNIRAYIETIVENKVMDLNCGIGEWYRIAHLNMSNSSQQCPSARREYNTCGVRACGRPEISSASCSATFYPTGHQYSRVCGRAIGYQIGGIDSFGITTVGQ